MSSGKSSRKVPVVLTMKITVLEDDMQLNVMQHAVDRHEEGWAPPGLKAQDTTQNLKTRSQSIPYRSTSDSTRAAPSATYQGGGIKCATVTANKINARDDIVIGTWNVRTLKQPGRVEELAHEMKRYRWNILRLSEVRWRNFGETTSDEGHKFYFSGREDKHEHCVGFLIHKDTAKVVLWCHPISSRISSIRLRSSSFTITDIQTYAPTSNYSDEEYRTVLRSVAKSY
ncbi:craniofacial development protein 2-like [Mercenaria mercenaria]|uniref:craniofacial development protein 2-like n=1 Tax=Mercenaria mercenaria TaxID=6596 RepID=UPI00234EA5E8|nr:craniofacial development protein 2-like [Mercenaria mercenaria]